MKEGGDREDGAWVSATLSVSGPSLSSLSCLFSLSLSLSPSLSLSLSLSVAVSSARGLDLRAWRKGVRLLTLAELLKKKSPEDSGAPEGVRSPCIVVRV